MCLTSADSQNWCVFLRFAVQGSLCPRRHWEWQQGLHNQVHATKRACHLSLQWKYLCRPICPSQNGSINGYQPFLWSHLAWKCRPFHSHSFQGQYSFMQQSSFEKVCGSIVWFFFFCTELWFCCWMQNNSQGWQTSGEPVLDINLWFSGKTHLKCKSCYWEHIVMIHHVNICLAA